MRSPELDIGAVYGAWKVVARLSDDRHGRARYRIQASCCGRQTIRERYSIVNPHGEMCVRCAGAKLRAQKAG